jgi:hypothetical protein
MKMLLGRCLNHVGNDFRPMGKGVLAMQALAIQACHLRTMTRTGKVQDTTTAECDMLLPTSSLCVPQFRNEAVARAWRSISDRRRASAVATARPNAVIRQLFRLGHRGPAIPQSAPAPAIG